ncbi:tetratricopeptide repeat protein [Corynebacterium sp.]|uniref:tetratricopeptide repeat protein n=1 Tax=Corynebacterium sp. TaxID=1720 RepID=UPI0026DB7889|nr:tetratricopeptide repeat protein [Corynebacterium sp.]MDO5032174.1 tetratricopeptide repeat protein [Corynebacterium sp.]
MVEFNPVLKYLSPSRIWPEEGNARHAGQEKQNLSCGAVLRTKRVGLNHQKRTGGRIFPPQAIYSRVAAVVLASEPEEIEYAFSRFELCKNDQLEIQKSAVAAWVAAASLFVNSKPIPKQIGVERPFLNATADFEVVEDLSKSPSRIVRFSATSKTGLDMHQLLKLSVAGDPVNPLALLLFHEQRGTALSPELLLLKASLLQINSRTVEGWDTLQSIDREALSISDRLELDVLVSTFYSRYFPTNLQNSKKALDILLPWMSQEQQKELGLEDRTFLLNAAALAAMKVKDGMLAKRLALESIAQAKGGQERSHHLVHLESVALLNMARLLFRSGDFEGSVDYALQSARCESDFYGAHKLVIDCFIKTGQYEKALETFEQAKLRCQIDEKVVYDGMRLYGLNGQFDEAFS